MSEQSRIVESKLADASDLVVARHAAFLAEPDDIETNHKLRVSIRTLRGLVDFCSAWQKGKQNKRVQRKLKKTVAKTSRLRELDVLATLAKEHDPENGELVGFLEGKASEERDSVYAYLASGKAHVNLETVRRELHDISWKREFDALEARGRFDALVAGLQADLDRLDVADYERVHSVRKRAKQVRYVAEQFNAVLGDDVVATAEHMKAQQDHLGAICDAKVNEGIIASFLEDETLSPTLAASLQKLV